MKSMITNNTTDLTTQTGKPSAATGKSKSTIYAVANWRLEKKEDLITKDGIERNWCTKHHYTAGEIKNRMYACHKTCDHDSWRKEFDKAKSKRKSPYPSSNTKPTTSSSTDSKKLALSK